MKKIVLTGGGTAGHVTPNLALVPRLKSLGYEIYYIGSLNGIEKDLAEKAGIPYFGISSGKLRRYFDWKNFTDPFRVQKGFHQAIKLLKQLKPDVIFSKGGFVSVPVVGAAKRCHVPAILHESDMTPGLANRLSIPHCFRICCNFPETMKHLPEGKAVLTGCPIRTELLSGDKAKGLSYAGFDEKKPVLLMMGGSTGSVHINEVLRQALPALLQDFQVIHLCGSGNLDATKEGLAGYKQLEYAREELPDLFAATDIVLSRAGANAICELLALRKPNLLIPLPLSASRGDQILNAGSFENQGYSMVLQEEKMTDQTLVSSIRELYQNRDKYRQAMEESTIADAVGKVISVIEEAAS